MTILLKKFIIVILNEFRTLVKNLIILSVIISLIFCIIKILRNKRKK